MSRLVLFTLATLFTLMLAADPEYPLVKKLDNTLFTLNHDVYIGYVTVDEKSGSKIFYQFFSAIGKKVTDRAPLLLWIDGGPGASGIFTAYDGMGPYSIVNDSGKCKPSPKDVTWNDENHLLFIDSPVGTGFSPALNNYSVSNTPDAIRDLLKFLDGFYKIPEFSSLKSRPLYLFGESYAGHYIPYLAYQILRQKESLRINLAAIGITGSWTDPITQVRRYADYAYATGMIGPAEAEMWRFKELEVVDKIKTGQFSAASKIIDEIWVGIARKNGNMSHLNAREYRKIGAIDPINEFLNDTRTKLLFGQNESFVYLNGNENVYFSFFADISTSFMWCFEYLINKLPILIVNGQDDFIVNTPGVWDWVSKMPKPWFGTQAHIRDARKQIWKYKGEVVGNVRVTGNFYFAILNKAGHLMAHDQRHSSRDMVRKFMRLEKDWS